MAGILIAPQQALAWSAKGHVTIAESAINVLPYKEQQYFNSMSNALLKNDGNNQWRKGLSRYSAFAQAAVWPDARRAATLATLFSSYTKGQVPPALSAFAPYSTARWHFSNQYFWNVSASNSKKSRCRQKGYGDLTRVWRPLIDAYPEAKTDAERGLVLSFLAHLLADAYQPLHAITGIDAHCKSDAGGNGYCLVESKAGKCQVNLHRLWDGGFGVFNQAIDVPHALINDRKRPQGLVDTALSGMGDLPSFIYSQPKGQKPLPLYSVAANNIVREKSVAAATALAELLSVLYSDAHHAP